MPIAQEPIDEPVGRTRAKPLDADTRRAEIIAATRHLLAANGTNFTTKAVAEAAGIAEGTIFRVFSSKRELIAAVIQDLLDPTQYVAQIEALPDADLQEHTVALLSVLRGGLQRANGIFSAMAAVSSADRPGDPNSCPDPGSDESVKHAFKRHQHDKMTALKDAVTASLEPYAAELCVSPALAAATVWMTAMASAHPFVSEYNDLDTEELAQLLIHGFANDNQYHSGPPTPSP
ncbi:MAG: TetR/AcrR family transcriptional regulator [Propionibacteriaceae bacterium]|jgi:AcrR family transcriptional regulator|nr:TetR/AcrR family transcriptional regulator [Propionibacteriaceae bacterium]